MEAAERHFRAIYADSLRKLRGGGGTGICFVFLVIMRICCVCVLFLCVSFLFAVGFVFVVWEQVGSLSCFFWGGFGVLCVFGCLLCLGRVDGSGSSSGLCFLLRGGFMFWNDALGLPFFTSGGGGALFWYLPTKQNEHVLRQVLINMAQLSSPPPMTFASTLSRPSNHRCSL